MGVAGGGVVLVWIAVTSSKLSVWFVVQGSRVNISTRVVQEQRATSAVQATRATTRFTPLVDMSSKEQPTKEFASVSWISTLNQERKLGRTRGTMGGPGVGWSRFTVAAGVNPHRSPLSHLQTIIERATRKPRQLIHIHSLFVN